MIGMREHRAIVIYGRDIRREGVYKYFENSMMPTMYSMAINERGIVTNHSAYPHLFGYVFDSGATDSEVADIIQTLISDPGVSVDSTECQPYGDESRVACATKVPSDAGEVTVIVGLHHVEGDSAFMLPNCNEFSLGTNAEAVFNDQSDDAKLEAYVKDVIGVSQQLVANITADELFRLSGGDFTKIQSVFTEAFAGVSERLFDKAACFGAGDFKHKNIYAFMMGADLATSTVFFNGNNFDLNGTNLELNDRQLSGEQNIARLFNNRLGDPVKGANTYVKYHWDDPEDDTDNVPNFFRDRVVPGTSCKKSYIEVADLNERIAEAVIDKFSIPDSLAPAVSAGFSGFEQLYIFGSGTYPGDDVCASGD